MSFLSPILRRSGALPRRTANIPSVTPAAVQQRRGVAKMTIVGRLGAEPEVQPTSTGQDVVRYVVGTSFGPRDNRQTSVFRVSAFQPEGPRKDLLLNLQKGTLVYVEGDASMRTFDDKDGVSRTALNITQRSLEILKRPESAKVEAEETDEVPTSARAGA